MPTAKPNVGRRLNTAHALAPNYAAWLLTGNQNPELDSVANDVGTVGANVTQSTNLYGEPCRSFPGTAGTDPADVIGIGGTANYLGTTYTIAARIYADAVNGFRGIYIGIFGFYVSTGQLQYYSHAAAGTINAATWYSVAYTRDGALGTLYIDGVSVGTHTASLQLVQSQLGIGGAEAGVEKFDGRIDYVYVWTRALSGSEINEMHLDPFVVYEAFAHVNWLPGTRVAGGVRRYSTVPSGLTPPDRPE